MTITSKRSYKKASVFFDVQLRLFIKEEQPKFQILGIFFYNFSTLQSQCSLHNLSSKLILTLQIQSSVAIIFCFSYYLAKTLVSTFSMFPLSLLPIKFCSISFYKLYSSTSSTILAPPQSSLLQNSHLGKCKQQLPANCQS